MTTANDLITRAMKSLGTLGRNEVPSAAEANDGLTALNTMLDSWSNERLASYVTLQRSFTLAAGTQSYTIGSGGVINTTRPTDIIQAFVRDSTAQDYPMRIVPRDIWNNIGDKTITSQIPDTLFYSSGFPLGTVYIFPIPLVNYSVFYDSTTLQVDFSNLTTALSMPPGYELAYHLNLSLQLMTAGYPCLLDDKALAMLVENARQAKGNIKRMNIKEVIAQYDEAIVAKSYASYNIYSDMPARG